MRTYLLVSGIVVLATAGGCDSLGGTHAPLDGNLGCGDDGALPTICNPVASPGQQGCLTGQKCTWIRVQETPASLGVLGCVPDGTIELGGACTAGPVGGLPGACGGVTNPTGYDNCAAGLYCTEGVCRDICGFDGSASALCASGNNCTRYRDAFANGDDEPLAGVCNAGCDPLTQTKTGTDPPESCGAGQGCYVVTSQTDTIAVCAGAGTVMHDQDITEPAAANSCVPGAQPRAKDRASLTRQCGGLCRVVDVTSSLNGASEGGEVTASPTDLDSCQSTWGALPPDDGVAGESCRYWWAREPFGGVSPLSNTLGWCFKHAAFEYDSDDDAQDDRAFPRCTALTTGDVEPPIGSPPHNDAMYFWCVRVPPPMLQGAVRTIKAMHARNQPRIDRLIDFSREGPP